MASQWGTTNTDRALTFLEVWADELKAIVELRCRGRDETEAEPLGEVNADNVADQARRAECAGLAFSGGGIRSATFNLGVIQALGERRLLRRFDYLSTVSGGGYIGGWLSALICRSGGDVPAVEDALARRQANPKAAVGDEHEHPAIRFLRRYSNYLTPRLGVLSGDTLTAVSAYLRNVLLNLFTLVSLLLAVLLLPHLIAAGSLQLSGGAPWLPWASVGLLVLAVGFSARSLVFRADQDGGRAGSLLSVLVGVVLPATLSAWLFSLWLASPWLTEPTQDVIGWTLTRWIVTVTLFYALSWGLPFALYTVARCRPARSRGAQATGAEPCAEALGSRAPRCNIGWLQPGMKGVLALGWALFWTLGAGAVGGLAAYGLSAGAAWWADYVKTSVTHLPIAPTGEQVDAIAVWYAVAFGAPLVLLGYSLAVAFHIGFMKRLFGDQAREWWARLGGYVLLVAAAWTGAFALALFATPLVTWVAGWVAAAGGVAWLASTLAGVLLGKGSLTGGEDSGRWVERIARIAPYVFVAGLLLTLAHGLHGVLTSAWLCPECAHGHLTPFFSEIAWREGTNLVAVPPAVFLWISVGSLAAFSLLSWRVDVNLFSINAFYRNRLTRCYLGASRMTDSQQSGRTPHPFTGFDPRDDMPLACLGRQRPLLIANTALNMVGGQELAWQTRRAASFFFTPRHSGFEFKTSTGVRRGGFRSTPEYGVGSFWRGMGRGVTLGGVMALSGAAANPNMGYHTSTALSLLMTVFDVRLGRWCGNPVRDVAWQHESPVFSGRYLISEALGLTTAELPFLNLSDGGHFENLGVYELVRRRCSLIVAVDAGCDPSYRFEDLANLIRKCRNDFGVEIEIDVRDVEPPEGSRYCASHVAMGCIRYPGEDPGGVFVYVKASLTGDEGTDVAHYASAHRAYPHQTTGDQFFDEDQFESYRALGHHVAHQALTALETLLEAGAKSRPAC